MKKIPLLFALILSISFISAQKTQDITKLLNKTLKIELKTQKDLNFQHGDTLVVIQDFKIDNKNVISFITKNTTSNADGYYLRKQEVQLKDILRVDKDICVLFWTNDKVKVADTTYLKNGKIETSTFEEPYFRTQFCSKKNNASFAKQVIEAFQKGGYTITSSNWYD